MFEYLVSVGGYEQRVKFFAETRDDALSAGCNVYE